MYPVMTLTRVVLPAPFGPIRPWIDPLSTSSDTPSTARTPPKWRWRLSRRRSNDSGSGPPRRPDDRQAAAADDPLRPEDDHRDQEDSADDVDVHADGLKDPWQQRDDQCSDHRPEHVAAAAEDGEGQNLDRACHAVLRVSRVDKEVQVGFERAREPSDDGAQNERDHLVAGDVDALAQRADLVLANRRPRAAQPPFGQPPHHEDHDDG